MRIDSAICRAAVSLILVGTVGLWATAGVTQVDSVVEPAPPVEDATEDSAAPVAEPGAEVEAAADEAVVPDSDPRPDRQAEDDSAAAEAAEVAEEEAAPRTTQATYDIRDLLVDVPDFTDAPQFEFHDVEPASPYAGTGAFRRPAPGEFDADADADAGLTQEERIEQIETMIKEVVAPDSWRDNGGSLGAVREIDGKLYVTQTPKNQAAVALLAEMRAVQRKTVRIRAHWVLTQRSALEPFLKPATAAAATRRGATPEAGAGARRRRRRRGQCSRSTPPTSTA